MRYAFLCLGLLACSRVQLVPLAGAPRRPLVSRAAVDVVVSSRPKCAFDEIGLMRVRAASLDEALNLFRDTARDIGAPQILLRSPTQPLVGTRSFEAVAVVPDCERLAPLTQ